MPICHVYIDQTRGEREREREREREEEKQPLKEVCCYKIDERDEECKVYQETKK